MEISDQKKKDVFEAFKLAIKDFGEAATYVSKTALIEKAMSYPAPRFYITYEQARRVISKMKKNSDPKISNPLKLQMYKDLYSKYMQHKKGNGYKVIKNIIDNEAPSFYINKLHFIRLVREALKEGL